MPTKDTKEVAEKPPTEIKVIGAGLGRTGTTSLKQALEILGFGPCHHMSTMFEKPQRSRWFLDAYEGCKMDWTKMMAGYNSTVDHPTTDFVPELMETFPNAPVILTVRDSPQEWWRSAEGTIYKAASPPVLWATWPIPFMRKGFKVGAQSCTLMTRVYGEKPGPAIYEKHNKFIKGIVPKKKLLEYNVKEGWEPLCKFLEVPVPDVPFPKANEGAEFKAHLDRGVRMGMTIWAVLLGILAVLLGMFVQWAMHSEEWQLFWRGYWASLHGEEVTRWGNETVPSPSPVPS